MVLNVLIVGGGIAGFTAAIALRRNGHRVQIFEQSKTAAESGAALWVMPNASSVLKKLGVDIRERGAVLLKTMRMRKANGEIINEQNVSETADRWQSEWWQAHRQQLHAQLKETATSQDFPGPAAELRTSTKLISLDASSSRIVLDDGTTVEGDVIVGADGINSIARTAISPDIRPLDAHHNAFRFTIARKAALDDPITTKLVNVDGAWDSWYAEDRKLVMYPCDNETTLNFVCIHPASLSDTGEGYNKLGSKKNMLEIFANFDPAVRRLLEMADPDTVRVYALRDMGTIPTFVKDRLALIGDAAHPFLPHLGQGAAQAIEDAASLGVMLSSGVTAAEIPKQLALFNERRYERATTVQRLTRLAGGDKLSEGDDTTEHFTVGESLEYALSHDEIDASTQHLRQHQWRSKPHLYWRQPIAFGPMPGPRQDFEGRNRAQSLARARCQTASITFRTSATMLRNLLVDDRFSFSKRDTTANASLVIQTYDNVAWLGGAGYSLLGFYIHGVQYRDQDNRLIQGSYLPIMFENLADPITSGREELGWPKVFSDINVDSTSDNLTATLSWRGVKWCRLTFPNLRDAETPGTVSSPKDIIFANKVIPATGTQVETSADADYVTVMDPGAEPVQYQIDRSWSCGAPSFTFDSHEWSALPTLHHIVSRLAELPIFDVVDGSVTEGTGAPDLSSVTKLNQKFSNLRTNGRA